MLSSVRLVAAFAFLAYAAFLLAVLTQYEPTVAIEVVSGVEAWLEAQGAPTQVTAEGRVEFFLNAAMFTPAVLLIALALPRHPWANWVVYGFVASGAVELVQGFFLGPRSAQMVDVVANTLGALVGAALALPVTRALRGGE